MTLVLIDLQQTDGTRVCCVTLPPGADYNTQSLLRPCGDLALSIIKRKVARASNRKKLIDYRCFYNQNSLRPCWTLFRQGLKIPGTASFNIVFAMRNSLRPCSDRASTEPQPHRRHAFCMLLAMRMCHCPHSETVLCFFEAFIFRKNNARSSEGVF